MFIILSLVLEVDVCVILMVTSASLRLSTALMKCSSGFMISGTVTKLSCLSVVSGIFCLGCGLVAGALHSRSQSNGYESYL